jgi:GMP synthase-like glutamine amidotransferase
MRILSMTHGPLVRAELFGDVVAGEGHSLEEWSLVDSPEPSRSIAEYDAVLVFGGAMNVDEEHDHPWLADENEVLRGLIADRVPLFGVCLGGQLLAKAAGGHVGPSPAPEDGFVPVELTDAAGEDPVFSQLPERFDALNLHQYAFSVPEGAVELARSRVCSQAIRVGECAWGVQFHPEVRLAQVEAWLAEESRMPPEQIERVRAELTERIGWWTDFGASLCRAFLAAAERFAPVRG